MQNNYYFLRKLTQCLDDLLPGFVFSSCYSQNKDELVLQFTNEEKEFTIKAALTPDFSCLFFPEIVHRARRNSVDLFTEAFGSAVTKVQQFENERSFEIVLENEYTLLFKMHGNRSNIILLHKGQPYLLFKNKLVKDWDIQPEHLHRKLDISYEAFVQANANFKKTIPTLGKVVESYLEQKNYDLLSTEEKWKLLTEIVNKLENVDEYFIIHLSGQPVLSLLEFGEVIKSSHSPVDAINSFFSTYTKEYTLEKEKENALQKIRKRIKSGQNYLKKTGDKLSEIEDSSKNREQADILMANLHAINPGSSEVTLYDFYHDKPIQIKLKKELSPQKNAENFYRKAKNQQLEEKYLKENIASKENQLLELELQAEQIESFNSLKELRNYLKEINFSDKDTEQEEVLPYRSFNFGNYQIWVGKGAEQNDKLIRYFAHKDDVWLHAKDVTGSHVIIKKKPGQNIPADVKEKAAELAAWYSKRKNDSLCPVICTPKKWIRKQKGAAPGAVVVDKEEEVLLVKPTPFK